MTTWHVDLPPLAVMDVARPVPASRSWTMAVTVTDAGETGRAPIAGGRVPVMLPEDYEGVFEIHLIADDGTHLVAVEGRRLPQLDD